MPAVRIPARPPFSRNASASPPSGRPAWRGRTRLGLALAAALGAALAPAVQAADGTSGSETLLKGALQARTPLGEARAMDSAEVRRWEHVVLVRTAPEVRDAIGRAQLAAMKAGGAVLADIRVDATASHSDYRLLVRTREREEVQEVLRAIRTTRGVLGATATALPETPTYPGGPSFFESYMSDPGLPSGNADRVVVRHDVPPIADKSELLEMTDVTGSPSTGPDGAGGFTLNVSELFARLKEGAWRRREDRLRATPIEILPPEATPASAP